MRRVRQRDPSFARCALAVAMGLVTLGATTRARADSGQDFIDEARLIYRMVACGSLPDAGQATGPDQASGPGGTSGMSGPGGAAGASGPAGTANADVVAKHCKIQQKRVARFQSRYARRAAPFFARIRPEGLPTTVVYPFGGGDLVSALITYPDATEITTISLEHAGDPRRVRDLGRRELQDGLQLYREAVVGLLYNHDSASENMRKLEQGPIPGQLSFFLQALAALGYEPVSLRYFRLEDDGSVQYLSEDEIERLEPTLARKKAVTWVDTDHSVAFSNAELRFRRLGGGPVITHRHISANLNNDRFPDSAVHKHLLAKGKVAAMTKAASYLLWSHYFSRIREYLLQNMVFMVSDSTGIPPRIAARAGFRQLTYGTFTGSFLGASEVINQDFVSLWTSQPQRALGFRYGYPDAAGKVHLMITRPRQGATRVPKSGRNPTH